MSKHKVKGHLCEGLKKFQVYADRSDCIPRFDEHGITDACDDSNHIPIQYCPFCGVKLDE